MLRKRKITKIEESNENERCEKHEAKLAARRAKFMEKEQEEFSLPEEEEIYVERDEEELPLEEILADQRRSYSKKEEYIFLIYNDLIENFVKKWEGSYLRKSVAPKKSFDELENHEDNESYESVEKNGKLSIDREKSINGNWKIQTPDEYAKIIFVNGNSYEGRLSRRKMEGQGLYRWRNGSKYKGEFEDNKIQGKGLLEWQDNAWYEGDFNDGYCHGKGTMVDKNYNLLYIGQWFQGHKHGNGYCRYENGNSYEGDWKMGKREGLGNRTYPSGARYIGHWKSDFPHGFGTMIWPNGDVYRGDWKTGKMHGYGEYTWNGFFNETLSWPHEICYMGDWQEGFRHGKGQMTLNSMGGARYSGGWRKNKKHGAGTIIGNNGELTEGNPLFENDILLPDGWRKINSENDEERKLKENAWKINKNKPKEKPQEIQEGQITTILKPEQFISLHYYVDRLRITKMAEKSSSKISLTSGKCRLCDEKSCRCLFQNQKQSFVDKENSSLGKSSIASSTFSEEGKFEFSKENRNFEISENSDISKLEKNSTWDCITMHMPRIRNIYDVYGKTFSDTTPKCGLSMSRLGLWQLWRDCGIHEKGLSLVEIDNFLAADESTLMEKSPCAFGRIEIWQLIHALVEVSWQLYTKNGENCAAGFSGKLANGLHKFLVNDVYPNIGKSRGMLCGPEKDLLPLYPVYKLYEFVGNTHSARKLLKVIFKPQESGKCSPMKMEKLETFEEGKNVVIVGDKLSYLANCKESLINKKIHKKKLDNRSSNSLFLFQELGIKKFMEIMSLVCPAIKNTESGLIVNMDYELTFLEFLEIFLEAGKQLSRMRKMKDESIAKENGEKISIDEEKQFSNSRFSITNKVTKSKKKISTKR